MRPEHLVVATPRKWVWEDFAGVGDLVRPRLDIVHSHGYGIPRSMQGEEENRVALWASTMHAARLKNAGIHLPLLAPGPRWMKSVPPRLLGRPIYFRTIGEMRHSLIMEYEEPSWIKLPEMKDDRLPAGRFFIRDFVLKAIEFGAPDETEVMYSPGADSNLTIVREDRFFVRHNEVVTGGPYMQLGDIWGPDKNQEEWQPSKWAWAFADYVVASMGTRQPPAYVLDIAQVMPDPNGFIPDYHVVLEANPAWSAGTYNCDMAEVLETVLTAIDFEGKYSEWLWQPDPWLLKKASMQEQALKTE